MGLRLGAGAGARPVRHHTEPHLQGPGTGSQAVAGAAGTRVSSSSSSSSRRGRSEIWLTGSMSQCRHQPAPANNPYACKALSHHHPRGHIPPPPHPWADPYPPVPPYPSLPPAACHTSPHMATVTSPPPSDPVTYSASQPASQPAIYLSTESPPPPLTTCTQHSTESPPPPHYLYAT